MGLALVMYWLIIKTNINFPWCFVRQYPAMLETPVRVPVFARKRRRFASICILSAKVPSRPAIGSAGKMVFRKMGLFLIAINSLSTWFGVIRLYADRPAPSLMRVL